MSTMSDGMRARPDQLARKAIVYLRQSSEKQVHKNLESQRLQYAMVDRARELGWSNVEVIDSDLGSSASAGAAARTGFERVLASVAMGEVGVVLSREVSRLSRTDKDWCRLLEIQITNRLAQILDRDTRKLGCHEKALFACHRQLWCQSRDRLEGGGFLEIERDDDAGSQFTQEIVLNV